VLLFFFYDIKSISKDKKRLHACASFKILLDFNKDYNPKGDPGLPKGKNPALCC